MGFLHPLLTSSAKPFGHLCVNIMITFQGSSCFLFMTFFDTFILEGKNKPAVSHQAVNLLYDYVTLWEEKKIMLARCCLINIVFLRMHY